MTHSCDGDTINAYLSGTEAAHLKIGIVLCGGFAKGAYQLGVLAAINEYFKPDDIACVSASSVGALNAVGFASGNLEYLKSAWLNLCSENGHSFIGPTMRGKALKDCLRELGDMAAEVTRPLYITLANISDFEAVYADLSKVDRELLPTYMRAAVSMPGFNMPVRIGKKYYIDGAWIDNIPVYPLISHALDYIICVHFDNNEHVFENDRLDDRILEITFPDTTVFKQSLFMDRDSVKRMTEEGYRTTCEIFGDVFRDGVECTPQLLQRLCERNHREQKRHLRLTTDVTISNINKLARLFARKRISVPCDETDSEADAGSPDAEASPQPKPHS